MSTGVVSLMTDLKSFSKETGREGEGRMKKTKQNKKEPTFWLLGMGES